MVSSLNINLAKSELFEVGVVPNITNLAWILGCKIDNLPSSYLGLPLEAGFKAKRVWERVVEKIFFRLESWKALLLSIGGRLTMLKATLASIPIYHLSLFTILASVASRIESKFQNFLWHDFESHHHYHLVDWKTICKPIQGGGLGVIVNVP